MLIRTRQTVSIFFFKDTATTEIYTLSLHDALPIWRSPADQRRGRSPPCASTCGGAARKPWNGCSRISSCAKRTAGRFRDRKSTRLNSSHQIISYAVFCLKKKNTDTLDLV